MPDGQALSLAGAKIQATAAQTRNANSVLHLFKQGLAPTPTTTLATFLDNECDFAGYAALTIVSWNAPFLLGASWATSAAAQYFRYNSGAGSTTNTVGGWFLVLSGGDLTIYGTFDPARNMSGDGMVVVVEPVEAFIAG